MIKVDDVKVKENPPMITDALEILYEDNHILVCIKPHGIATQSRQIGQPDMVSLLKNHIHKSSRTKGEPYLAVIHRLDQPVTGILVFAKTPSAAGELNRQMTHRGFGKYYRALVEGRPLQAEGILEHFLAKDPRTNLSRVCAPDAGNAKLARLRYAVVPESGRYFSGEYLNQTDATELEIRLDTGRHHQIRVQLAHIGCPIIGDAKYNPDCAASPLRQNICLCAFRLDFYHPRTGRFLCFRLGE